MFNTLTKPLKIATSKKTISPVITSLYVEFNLKLHESQIHLFREEILACIPNKKEKEIFRNETTDETGRQKNIMQYPLVQFRVRKGYAVLWALQAGVPAVEKFIHKYSGHFKWRGQPFLLKVVNREKENKTEVKVFNPALQMQLVVYRLYAYIPFTNSGSSKNYDWLKENRNLPDIEKTKKMEQLLTNHLCSFIHYSSGFIDKKKIKLCILDKTPLQKIMFKGQEYAAYNLRYTVNLNLPDYIGLGNMHSHGFGWQRLERE